MKTLTIERGMSEDGKTLYITDATDTYSTDLPARNTLALLHYFRYKFKDATEEVLTPASHSPIDVVTFAINIEPKDGVYYAMAFAVPRWTVGPLDDEAIVWDNNDSKLKQYDAGDDSLVEIEVGSLVGNDDINYGECNSKVDVQLTKYRDQLELIKLTKLDESLEHQCEEQEYLVAKKEFDYVNTLRGTAHIAFCMGQPLTAQANIETGINYAKKALNID